MNKADWLTAAAGILGVVGVGLGYWWADAVAAGLIGLDVSHDGYRNVRRAMADLMDHRPADVRSGEPLGLEQKIQKVLQTWPEVDAVEVRLREEGYIVAGEIFVVLTPACDVVATSERMASRSVELDWRLHDLVVMPVNSLDALV